MCEIHETQINHEYGEDFFSFCSDEIDIRGKAYKLKKKYPDKVVIKKEMKDNHGMVCAEIKNELFSKLIEPTSSVSKTEISRIGLDDYFSISTNQSTWINRINKLKEKYPKELEITKLPNDNDNTLCADVRNEIFYELVKPTTNRPILEITRLGIDKFISISTNQSTWINRINKLKEKHPDDIKIIESPEENNGLLCVEMPYKFLKLSAPKVCNLTDEQRKAIAERLKNGKEQNK